MLYTTATGDPGDCGYFPLAAVRWLTPPREIAALVTDRGTDRFTAELFHFGTKPRKLAAELYLLEPGRYTLELTEQRAGRATSSRSTFTVDGPRARVELRLPPRTPCTLKIAAKAE